MADHVLLMREGRIEQAGTPETLYARPQTLFAARFIGTPPMNVLPLANGPGGALVAGTEGPVVLPDSGAGLALGIRPEDIRLSDHDGLPAVVINIDYHGADTVVTARAGDADVLVRVPGRFRAEARQQVRLCWPEQAVHVFDTATGTRRGDRRPLAMAG